MFSLATSVRIRGRNINRDGSKQTDDNKSPDVHDIFQKRDMWNSHGLITISGGTVSEGNVKNVQCTFGPFYTILPPDCTQDLSYQKIMTPLIDSFLEKKMNCTVFAYGQTGSGKTHTLLGPPRFFNLSKIENWGLCPRTGCEILEKLQKNNSDWNLRCSAVELYFDDCYDLLNKKMRVMITGFGKNIKSAATSLDSCNNINRDPKTGKWIPPMVADASGVLNNRKTVTEEYSTTGTTEKNIQSVEDFLDIMQIVESTRSAKSHALNDRSSRSHCVVTLILSTSSSSKSTPSSNSSETRRFLFVDLAGSERINKTGVQQTAAAEAKNINTSLSALGRCIEILRKNEKKNNYIPWRDSALTMLMKQSLYGNCRTSLVVTINESEEMMNETISTLRFGANCGTLKNQVTKVETVNIENEVNTLKKQLTILENQIMEMKKKNMHGEMNKNEAQVTRDGFVSNYRKLLEFQKQISMAFKNGSKKNDKKIIDLKFCENNIKDILTRQIMPDVGLWREPKMIYIQKMQEKESIIMEIENLTNHTSIKRKDSLTDLSDHILINEMSWKLTSDSLNRNY